MDEGIWLTFMQYAIMAEYDALALGQRSPFTHDMHHINHCFDYVRQSLMCGGDTALGGWDIELNGQVGSTQMNVPHVCKNFGESSINRLSRKSAVADSYFLRHLGQIYDWLDGTRHTDKWQFGEEEPDARPPT